MWWNQYVGLPYRSHGRTRDGLDCWGLVRLVQREQFGRDLPSYDADYDGDEKEELAAAIHGHIDLWQPVPAGQEREGDVVLMTFCGIPCHVGIVLPGGDMLHVSRTTEATIERYTGMKWNKRIEGFYRYAE